MSTQVFYKVLCYLILALIYGKSWHKKVSFLQRNQIVCLQQTFTITELERNFRLLLKGCVNYEKCSVQYNSFTYFLNDLHYESLIMVECCFCTLAICGNHVWKVGCQLIKIISSIIFLSIASVFLVKEFLLLENILRLCCEIVFTYVCHIFKCFLLLKVYDIITYKKK